MADDNDNEDEDQTFCEIFDSLTTLLYILILKLYLFCKREPLRDNYQENDEEYFRRTVYIPLIDSIVTNL
ncbi:unnamed protein product [Parnassius mnemosyne]|uniref:Uncharacterized protein n=1 Tax=Parnassius mnemosyne TaxID=213953 RepID=A0AAV1M3X9_9NEOP